MATALGQANRRIGVELSVEIKRENVPLEKDPKHERDTIKSQGGGMGRGEPGYMGRTRVGEGAYLGELPKLLVLSESCKQKGSGQKVR